MKSTIFCTNLKHELKKHGFKITSFGVDILNISTPTLISKLKKCSFTLNELFIIEDVLNISYNDLITRKENITYKAAKVKKAINNKSGTKEIIHGSKYSSLHKYINK